MCCWYHGARGGGDGTAACLGMNRTISPSSNEEIVIYAKICSPRFHRNLRPWLDSFDPFDFFNFVISHLLVVASRKFSGLRLCRFGACLALSPVGRCNAEDLVHSSFIS
jgi:hypothetical protein